MLNTSDSKQRLSELEQMVMDLVWSQTRVSAEDVRAGIPRELKDSTVRTVLRRLEEKGFVRHHLEGRTYFYEATGAPQKVAAGAVQQIIDRFCGGSVEALLVGLVDNEVVDSRQLQRLAAKIAERKGKSR